MATELICEVRIWNQRVGALAEDAGTISFEYDPQFLATGLELSPFEMPLSNRIYTHLNRDLAFQGLMGVFADSLPDKFGNAIIEQYFRNKSGLQSYELSPIQKLLYVGKRATGALEYLPAEEQDSDDVLLPLEIANLVKEARELIQGDLHVKSADIMQVGVSAGGQYPKAVIAWNPQTNDVISGLGQRPPEGYQQWIIKFDGTEDKPEEFGKLEYAYSLMAKAAGIDMANTFLLHENDRAHFMVQRFDRTKQNNKLHMTSLCGLLHKDYNAPRLLDYEDFLRATLALTNSHAEQLKAYRRMVFNVISRNQDDHTKNFAYLMDNTGQWTLSPAFDLTYAHGNHFTARHQMTINGRDDEISRDDLCRLADKLDINDAEECINEVKEAVLNWKNFASEAKLSKSFADFIAEKHRDI